MENIRASVISKYRAAPAKLHILRQPVVYISHTAGTIFWASALGFLGLFVMFPVGSAGIDTIVLLTYPLVAGAIIGCFSPKLWAASGLVAWSGLILINITSLGSTEGVVVFIVRTAAYISLPLIGGYLGQMARKSFSR